jgi:hypothetical protein
MYFSGHHYEKIFKDTHEYGSDFSRHSVFGPDYRIFQLGNWLHYYGSESGDYRHVGAGSVTGFRSARRQRAGLSRDCDFERGSGSDASADFVTVIADFREKFYDNCRAVRPRFAEVLRS